MPALVQTKHELLQATETRGPSQAAQAMTAPATSAFSSASFLRLHVSRWLPGVAGSSSPWLSVTLKASQSAAMGAAIKCSGIPKLSASCWL